MEEVNFSFEFPAETSVLKDFVTSPIDPAPFQSYTGKGTAQCLAEGANLSISISGSDGYSDATSCPPRNLECQLGVPGAEDNVVDTLRFKASDSPTRTITRNSEPVGAAGRACLESARTHVLQLDNSGALSGASFLCALGTGEGTREQQREQEGLER